MYQFVKFSDLGPFTDIVHSHARFVNAPVGMLLDRQGRVVGHRMAPLSTRRFGTFGGTEGEDPNLGGVMPTPIAPPEFSIAMEAALPGVSEESDVKAVMEAVEEEQPTFSLEEMIKQQVEIELEKAERRDRARTVLKKRFGSGPTKATMKRAIKRAALAGIKASSKGDDITAERKAEQEAKAAGLSPAEVAAVGLATRRKVRKHMRMEEDEAEAVAEEVAAGFVEDPKPEAKHAAGVKRGPPGGKATSGGRGRGRPAGSKKGSSSNPLLNMKSQKQLKAIGKSMGFKPSQFKNRSDSIDKITTAASEAKTPVGTVVKAAEGKLTMPTPVLQVVQSMEEERKARGRSKTARGSSAARGKTREPRRLSPVGFVSQSSVRGRLSQAREKKKKKGGPKY